MKNISTILIMTTACLIISCQSRKNMQKGLQVAITSEGKPSAVDGLNKDSLKFGTRPSNVLLTDIPYIRLTTIYKINFNKDNESTFIGTNGFLYKEYESENNQGNNWNNHVMPGFEAVYGYNLINISYFDFRENKKTIFFEKPALLKTLYYPAYSKDTLNNEPVHRNYFMVSVYDDDTNKDGFINHKDLRRFYLYNIHGEWQRALIPENYSVFKSEYDPENDFMYVFAQLDENKNGKRDEGEPINVFWIDLKDPNKTGKQY